MRILETPAPKGAGIKGYNSVFVIKFFTVDYKAAYCI